MRRDTAAEQRAKEKSQVIFWLTGGGRERGVRNQTRGLRGGRCKRAERRERGQMTTSKGETKEEKQNKKERKRKS